MKEARPLRHGQAEVKMLLCIPVLSSASHATYIKNLKIQVFKILNLFHTSVAPHDLAYSAMLRCFEIVETAALLYFVVLHVSKLQI
jgi:hypothetical protein